MGISSINDFSANAAGAAQAASDYQTSKLEERLSEGYDNANAEELLEACKSFESYFMEQVLKQVDKSTPIFGSSSEDSYASKITDLYKDEMMKTVASELSESTGNTLAMQLYQQMKRNYGITDEADEAKAAALQAEKAGTVQQPAVESGTEETDTEENGVAGVSLGENGADAADDEAYTAGASLREDAATDPAEDAEDGTYVAGASLNEA